MKRYLLFQFNLYYPGGGWSDFKDSYDTVLQAMRAQCNTANNYDYYQIVDSQTGKVKATNIEE